MKDDILSAVVEVEKEIARTIESEETKAKEQIDKLRRETEHQIQKEKIKLQYALNRSITDRKTGSEKKVSEILIDANTRAERLEKTSDDVLKNIIRQYIVRILP